MEKGEKNQAVYCLTSHRRTITETDIVNFVNLMGLHEPPFIDMEWVKKEMPGIHNKRFAPAPFLISLGMGLVATSIMEVVDAIMEEENLGPVDLKHVLKNQRDETVVIFTEKVIFDPPA
jgi:acyl dehydratase